MSTSEGAMPVAAGEPIGKALRPRGGGRTAEASLGSEARLRDFGRRRHTLITIAGSLVTAAILTFLRAELRP